MAPMFLYLQPTQGEEKNPNNKSVLMGSCWGAVVLTRIREKGRVYIGGVPAAHSYWSYSWRERPTVGNGREHSAKGEVIKPHRKSETCYSE